MVRKYRGSEVPRPFNPATIKRMIEGTDAERRINEGIGMDALLTG